MPSYLENVESVSCPPRRPPRVPKKPIWMKDYVVPERRKGTKYYIKNYQSYDNIAPTYQSNVSSFSNFMEPQFFSEVVKDER